MTRSRRTAGLLCFAGLWVGCAATREPRMEPQPPIAPPAVVSEEAPGAADGPTVDLAEPVETVAAPAAPEPAPEPAAEPGPTVTVDDEMIATKILIKFSSDARLSMHQIDVASRDGVVVLTGRVGTPQAREAAEALARQTEGVARVDNRLSVD